MQGRLTALYKIATYLLIEVVQEIPMKMRLMNDNINSRRIASRENLTLGGEDAS